MIIVFKGKATPSEQPPPLPLSRETVNDSLPPSLPPCTFRLPVVGLGVGRRLPSIVSASRLTLLQLRFVHTEIFMNNLLDTLFFFKKALQSFSSRTQHCTLLVFGFYCENKLKNILTVETVSGLSRPLQH